MRDITVDTDVSIGRRTALRIISSALAVVAVFGLQGSPLRAQVELDLAKHPKDRAKAFARVRMEWGIKPAAPSETEVQLAVGDELTQDLQSFDEVVAALNTRLRRPMELLDVSTFNEDERTSMEHIVARAETRVQRSIGAFGRGEISLLEARAEIRQIFADYLEQLEEVPTECCGHP